MAYGLYAKDLLISFPKDDSFFIRTIRVYLEIKNIPFVDIYVSDNKCHVCLGSYNETAQHAKRQHNGAEESSRQQRRGARQGRGAGRGPGQGNRARQQGSGAGEQGKVAGQGRGAGQQGRARQQGRAASEIQLANGCRGAIICQKIC